MADFAFKPPVQTGTPTAGGKPPAVAPIPTPVDNATPDSLGLVDKPKVM